MIDRRAWAGALTLVVVITIFALVFARVPQTLLGSGGTTVRAVVMNPLGLTKGDPVRIDGVDVGTVRGIELGAGARSAVVELRVRDEGLPLHRDASVAIRERTLLGANFVVDLDPGTASSGGLGREPITAATSQVELEDVVNAFTPDARGGLRDLLRELPRGLADDQAPRAVLETLARRAPDLERGLGATRGEQDGDLRRLIADSAAVATGLDSSNDAIRAVVEGGAATLQTTAARRAELGQSLRTAAVLLPRVRTTVAALDDTLDLADPVIAGLRAPAEDLAPTVADLRPVVSGADRLLDNARPLLRSLRPAAFALARTARVGTPVLRDLTPAIERVQTVILRDLALDSPESGHSTFEMIGPALAGVVGAAAGYDRSNNFIRFLASGGEKAIESAPCSTSFLDSTADAPINCDLLLESLGDVFGGPR